jgi:hypothetical protein
MIDATEKLYGPYRWGRYDVLVLPPSFPFGGMENPRLTFATPTILAGDRSLVALVAHELAHSWSGNLVTNATWNDFWLNEGFTVYLERRIMEALEGREHAEMLAVLGLGDLRDTLAELGATAPDTHLRLSLEGRNPDDGMNDVAYEKGAYLLRTLEAAVGRERWDPFLRGWFDGHAFQSASTEDFVAYLERHLPQAAEQVGVAAWVYGPGLPANAAIPTSAALSRVEEAAKRWSGGAAATSLATAQWSTHEWLHFLRSLPQELPGERMKDLDQAFGFSRSGNSEILAEWLGAAIRNRYEPAYPALERFLTGMGRRKFLTPLYRAMVATPEGKEMALRIYRQARPGYHAVSRGTIDDVVGWKAEG